MTPKEQAIELVNKYYRIIPLDKMTIDFNLAKKCALIGVDEIIQGIYHIDYKHTAVYDDKGNFYRYRECQELKYWKEIKQEIEKL